MSCPLCSSETIIDEIFHHRFARLIYHCGQCDLRFVQRTKCLSLSEQNLCYKNHRNNLRSDGYTKFLNRLITPLIEKKMQNSFGLDYGSGPYPMLQELLFEKGFLNIDLYDPLYANQEISNKYDFVTCCEVVEHFINPGESWNHLCSLLGERSILVCSTGVFNPSHEILKWYYIQDVTHINFYTVSTFKWLANKFKLKLTKVTKDLVILEKE